MKTSITSIAKIAGGLTLMAASSVALASVVNTPHNLSVNGGSGGAGARFTGTTEICIFCHTPHGGNQQVSAPIWNRIVSSTSIYTRFSSLGRLTFDADEAPVGSVSIACLSCHDGTQARDAVINGPGSGNNNNSVQNVAGPGVWYDGTSVATAYLSDLSASDNGVTDGDLIYIGSDLRNDHPISMQYGGGTSGTTTVVTRDADFALNNGVNGVGAYGPTGVNRASSASTNPPSSNPTGIATGAVNYNATKNAWFIDTGTPGFQLSDFPLYTRTDGLSATAQPYVECATCHDPHSSNSTFLRLPGGNTRSQVCLTCHAK